MSCLLPSLNKLAIFWGGGEGGKEEKYILSPIGLMELKNLGMSEKSPNPNTIPVLGSEKLENTNSF